MDSFCDQPASYIYHGSNFTILPRTIGLAWPGYHRRPAYRLLRLHRWPHVRSLLQQHMLRAIFPLADTNSHRGLLRRHWHRCNLFRWMVQVFGYQVILGSLSIREATSSGWNMTSCWRSTSVGVDSSFQNGNHSVLASSRARILVCQRIRGGLDAVHVPCHMGRCDRPLV